MSKKLAEGVDALVLDVKVGNGAFMKKQVDARRLAQMMVGIGRRADKRVQALITDMNQPLGYAVGNALEVMEVSQTLQNAGPTDLTRLALELAARMIFLAKIVPTLDEAREAGAAEAAGRLGLPEVQGSDRGAGRQLRRFWTGSSCLPNATGVREIASPRAGYVSAIAAEDIGMASSRIGAGRNTKEDDHRSGRGRDSGSEGRPEGGSRRGAVPRLLHARGTCRGGFRRDRRRLPHFRAASRGARTDPGSGRADLTVNMERFTGILGILAILLVCVLFSNHRRSIRPSLIFWGVGLQLTFAFIVLRTPAARVVRSCSATK